MTSLNLQPEPEDKPVAIVKVSTSYYITGKKLRMQRDIRTMKRLSQGYDYFTEEFNNNDADNIAYDIELQTLEDGLYEVGFNYSTDWETGCVDVAEMYLVPYKGEAE